MKYFLPPTKKYFTENQSKLGYDESQHCVKLPIEWAKRDRVFWAFRKSNLIYETLIFCAFLKINQESYSIFLYYSNYFIIPVCI